MSTKILLIDDHPLFRHGMQAALQSRDENMTLVAVDSLKAARERLAGEPDIALALLDVLLLGENGLVALPALRSEFPAVPVIIITGVQRLDMVEHAMANGAQGFVSKSQNADEIMHAIQTVLDGGTSISLSMWDRHAGGAAEQSVNARVNPLSPRLKSILAAVAMGKPNKQIAREMRIAETTVRGYVSELLKTLSAKNRTEAVAIARERGWLS